MENKKSTEMKTLEKGSPKLINTWAFYDWSNSVYSLVISTAVFPIYYESVTSVNNGIVNFLGISFHNTTLLSYSLSLSFLIVASASSPISDTALSS